MNMIGSYLSQRKSLSNTCMLVESSHGIKDIDQYAIELLERHHIAYQVCASLVLMTIALKLWSFFADCPDKMR